MVFLKKHVFRNIYPWVIHFMQIILLFEQENLKSASRRVYLLSINFAYHLSYQKNKNALDSDWVWGIVRKEWIK